MEFPRFRFFAGQNPALDSVESQAIHDLRFARLMTLISNHPQAMRIAFKRASAFLEMARLFRRKIPLLPVIGRSGYHRTLICKTPALGA
jgi:hypothetical protein